MAENLFFRDYAKKVREDGGTTVHAITAWQRLCQDKQISIPMMSKTGLYLSGSHQGSTKVFRVAEDGKVCEEIFDSKMVTGKADFSEDDRSLVFVSRAEDAESHKTADAVFLADLPNNRIKTIYYGSAGGPLFFPGFLTENRIVIYERAKIIVLERARAIN